MARTNIQITVYKCIFTEQARKVKEAINDIIKKDSLSAGDTQAIRKLSEVYDVLSNPVEENRDLHLGVDSSGYHEVSQ